MTDVDDIKLAFEPFTDLVKLVDVNGYNSFTLRLNESFKVAESNRLLILEHHNPKYSDTDQIYLAADNRSLIFKAQQYPRMVAIRFFVESNIVQTSGNIRIALWQDYSFYARFDFPTSTTENSIKSSDTTYAHIPANTEVNAGLLIWDRFSTGTFDILKCSINIKIF